MDENQNGTVCGSRTAADALRRLDANANYLHAFSYLRHLLGSGAISKEHGNGNDDGRRDANRSNR